MMNKTPYSANIFLRSSFIKRFDDDASKKRFVEDETTMVDLKEENLSLKEKLEGLEMTLQENRKLEKKVVEATTEKERIERLYETGNSENDQLESQIAEFRLELLNVKREKND